MSTVNRAIRPLVMLFGVVLLCALAPAWAYAAGESSADSSDSSKLTTATTVDASQPAAKPVKEKVAKPQVKYKAKANKSWTKTWKTKGATAGSKNKSLQYIKVKLAKDGLTGSVKYRTYNNKKGWLSWAKDGKYLGTKNWFVRGMQMKLTGEISKQFDIAYRVFIHGRGWQPWVVNGATAGSTGKWAPVEKFKVKLVRKRSQQPLADGAYFLTLAKKSSSTLVLPGSKTSNNVQMKKTSFSNDGTNRRFYVRNNPDGTIALQSCASGLYLCERKGKVVQREKTASAAFNWKLSIWNGGYVLANAKTGNRIKFDGSKAVTASKGARWVFTAIDVMAEGTYTLATASEETLLAVKGESTKNKAKLIVREAEQSNAEVFKFARVAKNTYRITNVGSNKRIEVAEGSTAQKAVVRQNASNSGNLQKWKLILAEDGTYSLVNKASAKTLTALGGGASGKGVRSCVDKATGAQRWVIAAVKPYLDGPEARAAKIAETIGSFTNYFIAVDLTNHRVCIFSGSKGDRELIKSWPCATGAPGSRTPTGEYTTGYKQYEFGDGYSCYYATAFIGYEYLFHSVLYYKNSSTIMDGRLGQSISHGCVRLDIDNAKWIYNNIPSGTKVKIYY